MADAIASVYLGTGGAQPGVWAVTGPPEPAERLCSFDAGHSVYALAVDEETGLVAVGTRAGRVQWLAPLSGEALQDSSCEQGFFQGAPILSVCCIGGGRLVAADATGRCLLWARGDEHAAPKVLDAGSRVCALATAGKNHLVGLAADGRLVFWTLPELTVERTVECPKPPGTLALVRLVHWPVQNAMAFPGAGGCLVLCGLDGDEPQVFQAHQGELYAVMVNGEGLYTIGRQDGHARVWRDARGASEENLSAPVGVVSGQFLGDGSHDVVLVSEDGQAGVYALEANGFRLRERLVAQHFRSAAGASAEARQAHEEQWRDARARELAIQIRTCMGTGKMEPVEVLHRELAVLGYKAISLGLRAQWAARQEDLMGELRARHELVRSLPLNDPRSAASLGRYVAVLDRTWQLAEAQVIAAQGALEEDAEVQDRRENAATILGGEDWVVEVEPGVSLSAAIAAADLFGRAFLGRWVLKVAETIPLPDGDLSAEIIAGKYEERRAEDGRAGLPQAAVRTLWWLRRGAATEIETILFDPRSSVPHENFQLVAQVHRDGLQTRLVLCVLFHAGTEPARCDIESHNRQLRLAYEHPRGREQFDAWCGGVHAVLTRALRRLRTRSLALRTH